MTGQLIVSVSGIEARSCADAETFCAQLDVRGVPVSLLVAPRLGADYRLDRDPDTADWLRRRRADGAAIVLHGFDEAATKRRRGEFASLPAHEANLRLLGADRALEHLGLRTRLFAAPGWTVSQGTVTALPRNGFRLLAGLHGVTDLVTGRTERARVLGIGSGFPKAPWWGHLAVATSERIARRGGMVRLSVGARQLGDRAVAAAMLDAVDTALAHGCRPERYRWPMSPAEVASGLSA
ncbi:DUF2334 domain-containing protein [[Mycobacterium] vasticus]|uniref:DUF2334 domain-containing protein n=1 Tax=[Mycobacterium] vasticus TaxID=2875777 RepID=A0ABU5Z1G9_9MYCO|nr:DUF2334 domain-containing protein [Mycolicibacter sp. MYC017]MEB3070936.1 DUF2334 domain-containing protein [Mycolicibacter sp. MYC017]